MRKAARKDLPREQPLRKVGGRKASVHKTWRAPELSQLAQADQLGAPPRLEELGRAGDAGASAHYADASYYTKAYAGRSEDIEYYLALARKYGGPILEYGAGNGRITLPLARAGHSVTAIDLSAAMLADLRERLRREPAGVARRVSCQRGDMRRVRLPSTFGLVICPFNTFLHLYTRQDVERFLGRVKEHLAPGARFVFDVTIPHPEDLCLDPERAFGAPRLRHPRSGELVKYAERFEYDPLRQVLLVWMDFVPTAGSEPWSVPLTQRQFFPRELEALLHYNGFDNITFSADFSRRAPTPEVESLVVTCRAKVG